MNYCLKTENLTKIFGRRLIFSNINIEFTGCGVFGVTGANGSGKSTLIKILAGVLSPTSGTFYFSKNQNILSGNEFVGSMGFLSPYLTFYEEFTAEENIHFLCNIRGIKLERNIVEDYLVRLGLEGRGSDLVKAYSSGMKQRLKLIFAMIHQPDLLILDEPTSNLDNTGKAVFYSNIAEYGVNHMVLIASNEDSDLKLCKETLNIEDFKKLPNGKL